MWVLTEEDNVAALATYGAAGAQRQSTAVMLSWKFSNLTIRSLALPNDSIATVSSRDQGFP